MAVNNNRPQEIASYKECRRNHALSIGGHAVDGCREFAPSGAAGTEQAMHCQACGCHRSFHRYEVVIIRNLHAPPVPLPHPAPPPPPPAQGLPAAHVLPFMPVMVLHRAVNPPPPPPQPENADGEIDFERRPSVHQITRMRRHPF